MKISVELYCGLLLLLLFLDMGSFVKFKDNPQSRYKSNLAKVGVMASYPMIGIVLVYFNILPSIQALVPAFIAACVACYVMFIKYNGGSKRDADSDKETEKLP